MSKRTDLLANTESLESLPDAVMIVDAEGVIRFANQRTARLTGRTPGDLAGEHSELIGLSGLPVPESSNARDVTYFASILTAEALRIPVEIRCTAAAHGQYTVVTMRERPPSTRDRSRNGEYIPVPTLDSLSDGVLIVDAGESVVYANAEARRQFGVDLDAIQTIDLRRQLASRAGGEADEDRDQGTSSHVLDLALSGDESVQRSEAMLTRQDDSYVHVLVSVDPFPDENGRPAAVMTIRDVTRAYRSESQVSVQHDVLALMARQATIDEIGERIIRYFDQVFSRVLTVVYLYERDSAGFVPVAGPLQPDAVTAEFIAVQRAVQATHIPRLCQERTPGFVGRCDELAIAEHPGIEMCWCYPVAPLSGSNDGAICIYRNRHVLPNDDEEQLVDTATELLRIALERVQLNREIQTQRFNDELTGLPNRVLLLDRLDQALQRAERSDRRVALLLIDMDRLQMVNDSLGYKAGDELIQKAADRLRNLIRSGDLVGRFIGDEFGVVLEHINTEEDAVNVVMRVQRSFAVPLTVAGVEIYASLSIGVALADGPDLDADTLLRYADTALERAREGGRGQFAVFSTSQDNRRVPQLELQSRLYHALAANALQLYYQPLVSLQDGSVVGYEGLVRWHDEQFGDIAPDEFLPLAEQSGIMAEITAWVLDRAVSQATEWQLNSKAELSIGVNVSPIEVNDPLLIEQVDAVLKRYQFPPGNLTLELTEHGLMDISGRGREILDRLRNLGVSIALDDFGTGYSSLSYLEQLPVDCIKIDRTFIQSARGGVSRAPVAAAMVDLARNLGMISVAEGIEIDEDERIARRLGCDLSQGYYYGRPRPGSSMSRWSE